MRAVALLAGLAMALAACAGGGAQPVPSSGTGASTTTRARFSYGEAPLAPTGDTPAATVAFDRVVDAMTVGEIDGPRLDALVAAGDARHGWLISDLVRFSSSDQDTARLVAAFARLTGADVTRDPRFADRPWVVLTDHLIAWDLPAPSDYRRSKASLFTLVDPRWAPFFDDDGATIDWRWLSWGGVLMDDRPLGDPQRCLRSCIPALDDPATTDAAGGSWYPDDAFVFGLAEGDDSLALPKNIMEVHEMVNLTIGGRRLAVPYCTLCGSAQAYYIDGVPAGVEVPVMRTSGLLSRSNKVMYDLRTRSAFDTFTGAAVTGPLRQAAIVLEQTTVTVSTWGEWKAAHPDTRIIAADGGIGRSYDPDPLKGRDRDGPIFAVGDVDPRLPVHEPVVGVIAADGRPVAFPAAAARRALAQGRTVATAGTELVADGGGLRARTGGVDAPAHEAFWFAWSQFHPDTALWSG